MVVSLFGVFMRCSVALIGQLAFQAVRTLNLTPILG
jgi:hypothetical protein